MIALVGTLAQLVALPTPPAPLQPDDPRFWIELFRAFGFIPVLLAWLIVEVRRFLRQLLGHLTRIEEKMDALSAELVDLADPRRRREP